MTLKKRINHLEKAKKASEPTTFRVIFDKGDGTIEYNDETMTLEEFNELYPTGPEDTIIHVTHQEKTIEY